MNCLPSFVRIFAAIKIVPTHFGASHLVDQCQKLTKKAKHIQNKQVQKDSNQNSDTPEWPSEFEKLFNQPQVQSEQVLLKEEKKASETDEKETPLGNQVNDGQKSSKTLTKRQKKKQNANLRNKAKREEELKRVNQVKQIPQPKEEIKQNQQQATEDKQVMLIQDPNKIKMQFKANKSFLPTIQRLSTQRQGMLFMRNIQKYGIDLNDLWPEYVHDGIDRIIKFDALEQIMEEYLNDRRDGRSFRYKHNFEAVIIGQYKDSKPDGTATFLFISGGKKELIFNSSKPKSMPICPEQETYKAQLLKLAYKDPNIEAMHKNVTEMLKNQPEFYLQCQQQGLDFQNLWPDYIPDVLSEKRKVKPFGYIGQSEEDEIEQIETLSGQQNGRSVSFEIINNQVNWIKLETFNKIPRNHGTYRKYDIEGQRDEILYDDGHRLCKKVFDKNNNLLSEEQL